MSFSSRLEFDGGVSLFVVSWATLKDSLGVRASIINSFFRDTLGVPTTEAGLGSALGVLGQNSAKFAVLGIGNDSALGILELTGKESALDVFECRAESAFGVFVTGKESALPFFATRVESALGVFGCRASDLDVFRAGRAGTSGV
jgi:hypothetical protein